MRQKLKNRDGFTLAETLLAVLILLLVSLIVATGVPVAANAYKKVVLTSNAQVLLATTVDELRDEIGTAWDVKTPSNGECTSISYYSGDTGAMSVLSVKNKRIYVQEYAEAVEFDVLSLGNKAAEKERQLPSTVDNTTFASDLYVMFDSLSYSNGIVTFENLNVYKVSDNQKVTTWDDNGILKVQVLSNSAGSVTVSNNTVKDRTG